MFIFRMKGGKMETYERVMEKTERLLKETEKNRDNYKKLYEATLEENDKLNKKGFKALSSSGDFDPEIENIVIESLEGGGQGAFILPNIQQWKDLHQRVVRSKKL